MERAKEERREQRQSRLNGAPYERAIIMPSPTNSTLLHQLASLTLWLQTMLACDWPRYSEAGGSRYEKHHWGRGTVGRLGRLDVWVVARLELAHFPCTVWLQIAKNRAATTEKWKKVSYDRFALIELCRTQLRAQHLRDHAFVSKHHFHHTYLYSRSLPIC